MNNAVQILHLKLSVGKAAGLFIGIISGNAGAGMKDGLRLKLLIHPYLSAELVLTEHEDLNMEQMTI